MKKKKASISLEEVFARSEKDPKWAVAYEKAGVEVRMAIQIAQARERAKLTQDQLAKAIGTTQSVISRIERADQNLTLETLSKIADALHSHLVVQLAPMNAVSTHSLVSDNARNRAGVMVKRRV